MVRVTECRAFEPLFPPEFVERLPPYKPARSAWVVWLLKSGNPVALRLARQIDGWFAGHSGANRDVLRSRLRSEDDSTYLSAFFELVMHEFSVRRWGQPKVEPASEDANHRARLDFTVPAPRPFRLEVATIFPPEDVERRRKIIDDLLDVINPIPTPVRLEVVFHRVDDYESARNKEKLRSDLVRWLVDGDPRARNKQYAYSSDNVELRVAALPLPRGTAGAVLMSMPPVQSRAGSTQARRCLQKKVQQYARAAGQGRYVVGICNGGDVGLSRDLVGFELYGTPTLVFDPAALDKPPRAGRTRGLFVPERNTRISAVLYCNIEFARDDVLFPMCVMHNPFAKHCIPRPTFKGLPQFVPVHHRDGSISMKWINKTAPPIRLEG